MLQSDSPASVSFEFFPPRNAEAGIQLKQTLQTLGALKPEFISVTYGAGGSTQDATLTLLQTLAPIMPVAGHLTCVGRSAAEVLQVADAYYLAGVRHIVALRGDMPGNAPFTAHPQGFNNAAELITALKKHLPDVSLSAAAYPEKHPESPSTEADLDNLKRKEDAGADRFITQFFFDNSAFVRFYEAARSRGISKTIIPGILPIMNYRSTASFAAKCGASVPPHIADLFDEPGDDQSTKTIIAAVLAAAQVSALRSMGIDHVHFYTLNRSELTLSLSRLLGMRADDDRFRKIQAACERYF